MKDKEYTKMHQFFSQHCIKRKRSMHLIFNICWLADGQLLIYVADALTTSIRYLWSSLRDDSERFYWSNWAWFNLKHKSIFQNCVGDSLMSYSGDPNTKLVWYSNVIELMCPPAASLPFHMCQGLGGQDFWKAWRAN